tara:strand:+ start:1172 stop:1420 length:249 start_codon:yes stop_codon:yes gene_type:complete
MDIPGITPFSNQPTITNPLGQNERLRGQQTPTQQDSESATTVTATEQSTTDLAEPTVVTETGETSATGSNASRQGANIDITA